MRKLIILSILSSLSVVGSIGADAPHAYKFKKFIPNVQPIDATNPPTTDEPVLTFSNNSLLFESNTVGVTVQKSIVMSNLGNKYVSVANIVTSGGFNASYNCTTGTASLPLELPPGSSCAVTISKVSSTVAAVGTFSVTYSKGSSSAVSLSMPKVAGPALLAPSSTSVSMGGGDGVTAQVVSLTIMNTGEQSAVIDSVQSTGDPISVVEDCTHNSLLHGSTCNLSITSVGSLSTKNSTITVTYGSGRSLVIPVHQAAVNNNELGTLNVSASQLNFGSNNPGATASKSFTITNTSDWNTTVKALSVSPANGYNYGISCNGSATLPVVLSKNQSCNVSVSTTYGAVSKNSVLNLSYNTNNATIELNTPAGEISALTLSSSTIALPQVKALANSSATFAATNLSEVLVTVNSIQAQGGFTATYSCSSGNVMPVITEPGDMCVITVKGVGSSTSAAGGTVTINYADGSSSVVAVSLPRSLTPASLVTSLGPGALVISGGTGSTPEYGSIQLLNQGEESANISSIALTSGEFSLSQDCVNGSGVLPGNTTCNITVSGVGAVVAKTGTFKIMYDNDSIDVVVQQTAAVNNERGDVSSNVGAINYIAKDVGSSDTQYFALTNSSDWGATLKSISLPANTQYSINSTKCDGVDVTLPYVLKKGSICSVGVTTSYDSTPQTSTVSVAYNNTNLGVSLSTPTGLAPTADLDKGTMLFGAVNADSLQDLHQVATLVNNGNKNLVLSDLSLGGANASAFSVSGTCAVGQIIPGSSCTIVAAPNTNLVGDFVANISVTTSVGTKTINLSSSVKTVSVNSSNMLAGKTNGTLDLITDSATTLNNASSVKIYDNAGNSLLLSSSSVSWSESFKTLTAGYSSTAPAIGTYQYKAFSAANVLLSKGYLTVYNPVTALTLDNTGNGITQVDFGNLSGAAQKVVRIANTTNTASALVVSNVALTSNGPFSISAPSNPLGGAVCTSLTSMSIPAGASCDITITASATDGDYSTGYSLSITSNSNVAVSLPVKAVIATNIDSNWGATLALMDTSTGQALNKASGGTITVYGGAPVSASPSKTGTNSIYFNSAATYVSLGSNQALGTGDFTIEGWYYYISNFNGGVYFSGTNSSAPYMGSAGGVLTVLDSVGGTYQSAPLTKNTWNHIAYVRKAGVVNVYVNGVSQAGMTFNDSVNYVNNMSILLGRNPNYAYYVTGYFDQFRVTKAARYSGNFTPTINPYATQSPVDNSGTIASGGLISYAGNYAVHTFNINGTFQFTGSPIGGSATVYVVGGGGGAGWGGGAGGAVNTYNLSGAQVSPGTSYSVSIGAGGAGSVANGYSTQAGISGGASSFGSMTALGGGGGGGIGQSSGQAAKSGANGGGGACAGTGMNAYAVGGTSTGGGFAGGNGWSEDSHGAGAGGGGAAGAGSAAGRDAGGNGGLGKTITLATGSSWKFGSGGKGINCQATVYPTDAAPNTGDGGVAGNSPRGGNGGSGVVIVVYQYK